jgi:hypothetical protein
MKANEPSNMTDTVDKAELLPCPHCGEANFARVKPYPWEKDGEADLVWGFHVICDASGFDHRPRGCGASAAWGETEAEAIAAWNRRASPTLPGDVVVEAPLDKDELLSITDHLMMLADIDEPAADEPDCTDLCGNRVCDQLGCVVSKWRRVRAIIAAAPIPAPEGKVADAPRQWPMPDDGMLETILPGPLVPPSSERE